MMYNKYLFIFLSIIILGIYIFFKGLKLFSINFNNLKLNIFLSKINDLFPITIISIGILFSATVQSTAISISLLIPLVHNKCFKLKTAMYLIIGFNIGTVFSLLLSGLSMLYWNIILIILSVTLIIIYKITKNLIFKQLHSLLIGILFIFTGLLILKTSFKFLTNTVIFQYLLINLNNNTYAFLLGIILSAIVQSGSIICNAFQELYISSSVSLNCILLIILGSNIGSTFIGIIASIKYSESSKIIAYFHILLNLCGAVFFLIFFNTFKSVITAITNIKSLHIAYIHLIFNLCSSLIMLPLINKINLFCLKNIKKGT